MKLTENQFPTPLPIGPDFVKKLTMLACEAAGAILALGPGTPRLKDDRSPVTRADEAAEAVILAGLAQLAPGIPIVSEEASSRAAPPSPGATFFLIDPLDGTKEFIAGRDEYTVNIALIADGEPTIGIIAAPALGLVWRGMRGAGAQCLRISPWTSPSESWVATAIHTRPKPAHTLVATVSRSHFDAGTAEFLKRVPAYESREVGSAVKFCRIAEGSADLYPRLAPTCEWDIAAGHAILAAAGGMMTAPDGSPLNYGNAAGKFLVPAFIAWGDLSAAAQFTPAPPAE